MYATCSGGGWGFFQCCRYSERPWIILSRTFAFLKQLIIFYICAVRKEKRKRKSSTLYFSFEREFFRPTPLICQAPPCLVCCCCCCCLLPACSLSFLFHFSRSIIILLTFSPFKFLIYYIIPTLTMHRPSHKSFRTKQKLGKKMRQNRPIPQWIRLRTGNTIRYNAKRRQWRRTKLGI